MKNLNHFNLAALDAAELTQLQSGNADGGSTSVWAGEDGRGCIPPWWPPLKIPLEGW